MQEVPLQAEVVKDDAYRRVMLDHTELITRVYRIEDRAKINTCLVLVSFTMSLGCAIFTWLMN